MSQLRFLHKYLASMLLGVLASAAALGQEIPTVQTVVTAVANGKAAPALVPRDTVTVSANGKRQEITGWTPLRGSRSGLQLVILLDDSLRSSFNLQLPDLARFMNSLPPEAQVSVAYMRNGTADLLLPFTTDHARAVKSLRTPIASPGINGSPYFCLMDLVKHWPNSQENVRREVIMVSDGVDRYSGRNFNPQNSYVLNAIEKAQKAGIIVYSIYYSGAGGLDSNETTMAGGENYLMQLSSATGGESYNEGFGNPVSLLPFLSDIQRQLENQYELEFASSARKGMLRLQVKTSQPHTKLQAAEQVLARTTPRIQ